MPSSTRLQRIEANARASHRARASHTPTRGGHRSTPRGAMLPAVPDPQHAGHPGLHRQDKFTDMTMVRGKKVWKLHRVVMTECSPVLDAALSKRWQEGVEAEYIIDEEQFDEGTLDRMIQYIYTGEYDIRNASGIRLDTLDPSIHPEVEECLQDIRVYAIADYFGIESLLDYAVQWTDNFFADRRHFNGFATIIELADQLVPGFMPRAGASDSMDTASEQYIEETDEAQDVDDAEDDSEVEPRSTIALQDALRYAKNHAHQLLRDKDYKVAVARSPAVQAFHAKLCIELADGYDELMDLCCDMKDLDRYGDLEPVFE